MSRRGYLGNDEYYPYYDTSEEEDSDFVCEEDDPNSYSNQSEYEDMNEMEEFYYNSPTQSEYEDANEMEESPVAYSNQNEVLNYLSLLQSRLMSAGERNGNERMDGNSNLNSTLDPYNREHIVHSFLGETDISIEGFFSLLLIKCRYRSIHQNY